MLKDGAAKRLAAANSRAVESKQTSKDKIECNTIEKMEAGFRFREHFGKLGNSVFGKRRFARNRKDMRIVQRLWGMDLPFLPGRVSHSVICSILCAYHVFWPRDEGKIQTCEDD